MHISRTGVAIVVGALVVAAASVMALRGPMRLAARESVLAHYASQIAQAPEDLAIRLVRHAGENYQTLAPALAASLADRRPKVRSAAAAELAAAVERFSSATQSERSRLAAELAAQLAQSCTQMPLDSRAVAQGIARAILNGPLDGHSVDPAQTIADCEQILALPLEEIPEFRVADARKEPARLPAAPATRLSDE